MTEQNETLPAGVVHSREEYEKYAAQWDSATFWEAVRWGYDPAPTSWRDIGQSEVDA